MLLIVEADAEDVCGRNRREQSGYVGGLASRMEVAGEGIAFQPRAPAIGLERAVMLSAKRVGVSDDFHKKEESPPDNRCPLLPCGLDSIWLEGGAYASLPSLGNR